MVRRFYLSSFLEFGPSGLVVGTETVNGCTRDSGLKKETVESLQSCVVQDVFLVYCFMCTGVFSGTGYSDVHRIFDVKSLRFPTEMD